MSQGAKELDDRAASLEGLVVDAEADAELRRCLEQRLGPLGRIHRASFGGLTSFNLEVLTVELAGGLQTKVLLKDLGASRLHKDDLEARRERELRVYRELLATMDLGTAEFYGAVWDEHRKRFWLLLELVESVELRSLKLDAWMKTAAWLGRLHGRFARRSADLHACDFLIHHDAGFFHACAKRALEAVAGLSERWGERLATLLEGYDRVVAVMTSQPRTLVHGSCRKKNILLQHRRGATRVLAVDWEFAGFGAPLYDLAFLADGAGEDKLDRLWEAYSAEASSLGLVPPGRGERGPIMDCFRLHKTLKSLVDSVSFRFEGETVLKLIATAEDIRSRLFT